MKGEIVMTKKSAFKLGPLQKKWLKALRSGKFRQGKGALKIEAKNQGHPKYCCLGVANEVCKLGETDPENATLVHTYKKLGLRTSGGEPKGEHTYSWRLTELNDEGLTNDDSWTVKKMTFKKIADHIEQNASAYFKASK